MLILKRGTKKSYLKLKDQNQTQLLIKIKYSILSKNLLMSKPTDNQLRGAIDAIFSKYDTDNSGTLQDGQIFHLINDAFKSLGRNKQVSQQEVKQFINAIDKNSDGKIQKPELFDILKKLING